MIKQSKFSPRIEVRTVRAGKPVSKETYISDSFFNSYPSKSQIDSFRINIERRNDLKDNTVYVVEVSEHGIRLLEEQM